MVLYNYYISSMFPLLHYLFVTSPCYLFEVTIGSLSVCYVTIQSILSLQGFHCFIICLLRYCSVLCFDCLFLCFISHYSISPRIVSSSVSLYVTHLQLNSLLSLPTEASENHSQSCICSYFHLHFPRNCLPQD